MVEKNYFSLKKGLNGMSVYMWEPCNFEFTCVKVAIGIKCRHTSTYIEEGGRGMILYLFNKNNPVTNRLNLFKN